MNASPFKLEIIWPEVFTTPSLVDTREPAPLCADGLCAWANCHMGAAIPASFGEVLVKIAKRLGLTKGPTAENLSEHAVQKGWLETRNEIVMNLSQLLSPSSAPPWLAILVLIGTVALLIPLLVLYRRSKATFREWRKLEGAQETQKGGRKYYHITKA